MSKGDRNERASMSVEMVPILQDVVAATQQAKILLDEGLRQLAEIEATYNKAMKAADADSSQLAAVRAIAEDQLRLDELIDRRQQAVLWAALVDDCVRICECYTFERVVLASIRQRLREHGGDDDLELFAMMLMRHVRDPEDTALYEALAEMLARLQRHDHIESACNN